MSLGYLGNALYKHKDADLLWIEAAEEVNDVCVRMVISFITSKDESYLPFIQKLEH